MTFTRRFRIAVVAAALLTGMQGAASWALTDEEIFRDLGFNLVSPGARAVGMGGAFIATADDVTAAAVNPAALHHVGRLEFLADYRSTRPQTRTFEGSNPVDLSALPVALPLVDLSTSVRPEDDEQLSFFGFALPLPRARTTFAISRNVVFDTTSTLAGSDNRLRLALEDYPLWINPQGGVGNDTPTVEQYAVQSSTAGALAAELVHTSLSAGIDLSKSFSLGVTATLAELDMTSTVVSTSSDPRGLLQTINPRVDADQDGLLEDVLTTSAVDGSDSAVGFSFGVHFHPEKRMAGTRLGMVYHRGAELSVSQQLLEGQSAMDSFQNVVKVPDRFGVGIASAIGGRWQLALDVEHVAYSDLLDGFRAGVNSLTSGMVDPSSLQIDPDVEVRYDVDDAVVVRGGVEYGFGVGSGWQMAARAGGYTAPDDRIRMTAFNSTDPAINAGYLDVFGGGEDETHVTAGLSLQSPRGLTLHVAGDFAGDLDQILFTVRYPFGKRRR